MNKYIYEISSGSAELVADTLKSAKEKLSVLKEFISKHYNQYKLIINRININTGDEKIIYRKEVLLWELQLLIF